MYNVEHSRNEIIIYISIQDDIIICVTQYIVKLTNQINYILITRFILIIP